jgi:hypothetical protein
MSVTIKGLARDHDRAYCMGEYTKTDRVLHGRSVYVGGRDGDMALSFDGKGHWMVSSKAGVGGGGFVMSARDSAATPDRIVSPWLIGAGKHPDSSVRVRKFKNRETTLILTGLSAQHVVADCMGRYTRQARTHDKKPTYKGGRDKNMVIWFVEEESVWCVGSEKHIGTGFCSMYAIDNAPTPDAVLSTWNVRTRSEPDERVHVCSTSTAATTASQLQQQHSAPPTIAVVGLSLGASSRYAGVYTKQLRKEGGMVVYEGGLDGKQAVWQDKNGWWRVGEMVNIGTNGCYMYTPGSSSISSDAAKEQWQVSSMKPCSSARVTKSKKKHTKVVEVKGVFIGDSNNMAVFNGKYRQKGRMIGGRPTFKGGQYSQSTLWYDEHEGKWCGCHERSVGTGMHLLEAKDTALTPDKVKATWQVLSGFEPSPYPNIIVPSVEAVEQEEVPRLMQLKMSELMAAQHKRCLGCGHEYTAAAEVVFHCSCMHHHCVCCEEEQGDSTCVVCAQVDE